MNTSKILGYAALEQRASLTQINLEPPDLKDHEVRIAITHCGVCGTDIQGIDDYYYITKYPFVPGHEIVGVVAEVGKSVPRTRLDQRVGVGWQGRSCGHCEWCQHDLVNLCEDVIENATWKPYGGFSTSIAVDADFAYPLPDSIPSPEAAVLMCAGITVYSALKNFKKPHRQVIGIMGIGGLGHLAIQFARAMGYEVTAISMSPEKKEEALALGAHNFMVFSDREAQRKYTYFFDFVLCTSHGQLDWESMLDLLKRRGEVILTGFPDMDFRPIDVIAHELCIRGSFIGTQADMREMLLFSQEHPIKPMIELMPMSQVNAAIQKVRQNKVRYRVVLENDL